MLTVDKPGWADTGYGKLDPSKFEKSRGKGSGIQAQGLGGGSGSSGGSSGNDQKPHVYGDPNAVITRGSVPNFDILDTFRRFGYYPTQEEIDALAPSFSGRINPGEIGSSAVANYVIAKKAEYQRQQSDPLVALQKKMDDSIALMKNQVQGLYGQLQDTLSSAPKLFGDLTPDQIQTYLAPLKTSFDQQLATVQGVVAQRGLAGSSTENNALAAEGGKFQQNVLSTGLQVGMESQKNKAAGIQAQINNLFGLTGTEEGLSGRAAEARSAQDLSQSNLIASLPFFLNNDAFAKQQALKASQGGGTNWGAVGSLAGTVIGGVAGSVIPGAGTMVGAGLGGAIGGGIGSIAGGSGGGGGGGGYNPSNALFLASLMNKKSGPSAGDVWGNNVNPEQFDTFI